MKRIIATLLAAILTAGCAYGLIGCSGGSETAQSSDTTAPSQNNGGDVTDTQPGDGSSPGEQEPTLEVPDVTYEGADFLVYMGGQGVGIGDKFNDFGEDNLDYTSVSTAIFKRNKTIEKKYDIKIESVEEFANENGSGPSFVRVSEDYLSGECPYSMYEVGTMAAANLARNGYVLDLNATPYIDLSKPWWDQGANRDLQVQGKMYYTTGDISVVDNLATHNIYFSKTLARTLGINDLYSLVEEGKWTIDKYSEYVKMASAEVTGDDTMDENDRYGALIWNDSIQATLIGCGVRTCTINEDGEVELTLYSDKSQDIVSRYTELCFDRSTTYNYVIRLDSWQEWDPVRIGMFTEDRALFFKTILNTFGRLRDADVDFGILPYPKYNEAQENYGSYVGASYSVMICLGGNMEDEDLERNSALIEAMAYYSRELVTPEYYDSTLKGKLIRDEESAPCLDIIIGNRFFDVGIYYLIGHYTWDLTEMMKGERNDFTVKYEQKYNAAMKEIEKLNADFVKAGFEP